jgi:hypothetical protein
VFGHMPCSGAFGSKSSGLSGHHQIFMTSPQIDKHLRVDPTVVGEALGSLRDGLVPYLAGLLSALALPPSLEGVSLPW